MIEPRIAAIVQSHYCEERDLPEFAPKDGVCPWCCRTIYSGDGYDYAYAATTHITGCPICNHSFCD